MSGSNPGESDLAIFVGFPVIGLKRTKESAQRANGEAPVLEFIMFDSETISSFHPNFCEQLDRFKVVTYM